MRFQCPGCSFLINVPDEKVGERGLQVRCPSCKQVTRFFRKDATSTTHAPVSHVVSAPPKIKTPEEAVPQVKPAEAVIAPRVEKPPKIEPEKPVFAEPQATHMKSEETEEILKHFKKKGKKRTSKQALKDLAGPPEPEKPVFEGPAAARTESEETEEILKHFRPKEKESISAQSLKELAESHEPEPEKPVFEEPAVAHTESEETEEILKHFRPKEKESISTQSLRELAESREPERMIPVLSEEKLIPVPETPAKVKMEEPAPRKVEEPARKIEPEKPSAIEQERPEEPRDFTWNRVEPAEAEEQRDETRDRYAKRAPGPSRFKLFGTIVVIAAVIIVAVILLKPSQITPPAPILRPAVEATPPPAAPVEATPAKPITDPAEARQTFARGLLQERLATPPGRKAALDLYGESLRLDPSLTEAKARILIIRAQDLSAAGDTQGLTTACSEADKFPDAVKQSRDGKLAQAMCLFEKKDIDGALKMTQDITRLTDEEQKEEDQKGEEAGRKSAERGRQVAEGYVIAAMVYETKSNGGLNKKSLALAEESLKAALAKDPANVVANLRLAKLVAAKKGYQQALDLANAALKASPASDEAKDAVRIYGDFLKVGGVQNIPGAPVEMGTEEEKKAAFKESLATAKAYRASGKYQAAVGELDRALKLQPGSAEAAMELGWNYLEMDKIDAAIDQFSMARGRSPRAYKGLGAAYQAKGDKANALINFQSYLNTLKPDSPEAGEIESVINNLK